MKKLLSILLALAMVFSFAACGSKKGPLTSSVLPYDGIDTLNKIVKQGFEVTGTQMMDNIYVQNVVNAAGEEYVVVVKIQEDQLDAMSAIDFFDDNAVEKYHAVIGDNQVEDILVIADVLPDQDYLDVVYKGMTIAEFEAGGAYMNGYAGSDGEFHFDFEDDSFEFEVELEAGTKLEDLEDMDLFDAAIQDLKIGKIICKGLSYSFMDNYLGQFFDEPEPVIPEVLGEQKASLDEINKAVGSSIQAVPGAVDEVFSVIDGKIAQYICVVDGTYYCIRSVADEITDISDDSFPEDPIKDQDGNVITSYKQTDDLYGVRFMIGKCQYAFMIYDGNIEYEEFNKLYESYYAAIYSSVVK